MVEGMSKIEIDQLDTLIILSIFTLLPTRIETDKVKKLTIEHLRWRDTAQSGENTIQAARVLLIPLTQHVIDGGALKIVL